MTPNNSIDVSEADFEAQVIAYSHQVPVVVDFWATWCAPCRVLGPMLERMAGEAEGAFRLAKVNVDENPNLSMQYGVRSIPTVKAFKEGRVVAEFTGAQPEPRVREFLRGLIPTGTSLALEKGQGLLELGQWAKAETVFRQALQDEPSNPQALLGLARSLLFQGFGDEAQEILQDFPASREYTRAEILLPLADALAKSSGEDAYRDDPQDAAFNNSLRLVERGNVEAAMDGLLDLLRQDKRYRNGEARRVMLGLLALQGDEHPSARQYRSELASVLF